MGSLLLLCIVTKMAFLFTYVLLNCVFTDQLLELIIWLAISESSLM